MSVTFQGKPVSIKGIIPLAGMPAPKFELCSSDLDSINIEAYKGKKLVLNIFPSIDTKVCASSVRSLSAIKAGNSENLNNVVILCVSKDLPFAMTRFLEMEGISNCLVGSCFRSPSFMQDYGVEISGGPLKGLASRALIVINETGTVKHSELVSEITKEPNYKAALLACMS